MLCPLLSLSKRPRLLALVPTVVTPGVWLLSGMGRTKCYWCWVNFVLLGLELFCNLPVLCKIELIQHVLTIAGSVYEVLLLAMMPTVVSAGVCVAVWHGTYQALLVVCECAAGGWGSFATCV